MNHLLKLALAAALAAFFVGPSQAQNTGSVTNHAFVIGKGAGTTGYTSLLCGSAQLAVGQAAADPICRTLSGDVTLTAAGVTAIGASKVTNSQLATMAANTTKCNATAGTANPTDCNAATMRTNMGVVIGTNVQAWDTDLDCLAALSSTGVVSRTGSGTCSAGALALSGLATGTQDTVIGYWGSTTATAIAINNCTGALTYSTTTHTFGCNAAAGTGTVTSAQVSAGAGISVSGTCTITTTGNCTVAQSLTNATLQASPSNPTGTGNVTGLMMGLGTTCKITPVYSGRVHLQFQGSMSNTTSLASVTVQVRYGTGTAPANASAITGTAIGSAVTGWVPTASGILPFGGIGGVITGLSAGTAYWFDVSVAVSSGTGTITAVSCSALEF